MPTTTSHVPPSPGLSGFKESWRNDLIAGFSVALVALPLGLGISIASNAPPISGVLAAILGGLITTFLRSSKVTINGPGNGLIVVILTAVQTLGEFKYVLAAILCAGALLMLSGILRLGKLGDMLPTSVIQGLLAAIGLIIVGKQVHVALGVKSEATSYMGVLQDIPNSLMALNPYVAMISFVSLFILIAHPKIKNKLIHFVPAPIWVLAVAIPMVYYFNFFQEQTVTLLSRTFEVGPTLLVQLPNNLVESIIFADFAKIGTLDFWVVVFSITIVGLIETLISTAAIDKLDPFKRKTNLNRDLMAVGATTMVAGLIGSLPVITVIVRSSVNINHGAKTKASNFFHGSFLLIFVLLLAPLIQLIPLAALAALLVYSGYKLTSPKVFKDAYKKGPEQLILLVGTLYATLQTGLITGILIGIAITLILHLFKTAMPLKLFVKSLLKPVIQIFHEKEDEYLIKITGISNFITIPKMLKQLDTVPPGKRIDVDFSMTNLVDLTVMEFIEDYGEKYERMEGEFHVIGLDLHLGSSDHPHALRVHIPPNKIYSLTSRQHHLKTMCESHNWSFEPRVRWGATENIRQFQFFDSRPIEYRNNLIRGEYKDLNIKWEVSDVTFDEGALLATEVYRTTVQIVQLDQKLPVFTMEQEELFDKFLEFTGYEDIDFKMFTKFSSKFLLKGQDEEAIRNFFTKKMITFFEREKIYHLESSGSALFIFKNVRLASPQTIEEMVLFTERLIRKLQAMTSHLPQIEAALSEEEPSLSASEKVE